ncbi:hypothetical protein BV898_03223 [Hypsibius exemplaris]|uniref:Uncharacterized protein n=1 Tax=Hypsibius exemplaris TaxID=2072580 RepID=A0A1W0X5C9_HYPEX|nr:hypothetical protein BV898_03223 [Hypsibius exemplaris]
MKKFRKVEFYVSPLLTSTPRPRSPSVVTHTENLDASTLFSDHLHLYSYPPNASDTMLDTTPDDGDTTMESVTTDATMDSVSSGSNEDSL